jgi:hypothetical protein
MTQDEIIEIAIENTINGLNFNQEGLVRFARLVAAKSKEEANAKANASWTLMCKKMVALEREACAKVCDALAYHPEFASDATKLAAMAIRARRQA